VRNLAGQVELVAAGAPDAITNFESALLHEAPPFAMPRLVSVGTAEPPDCPGFTILPSCGGLPGELQLPPDRAVCAECLAELHDPTDRRYRYPFLSCTQCGPRYTLIRSLPYDRLNTTQVEFPLCPQCASEYADPSNRRFHAETTACPACGPRLTFSWGARNCHGQHGEPSLQAALAALRSGHIVAVKGIGGYHLLCDAANSAAVACLRERKHRPHKPLAVMFPDEGDLATLRHAVDLDPVSIQLLRDPARPIVLLPRQVDTTIADAVAPGCDELGVILPYSPLHHLLLDEFAGPLVATSGNISGEPVLFDNHDATARLAGIADAFLHHDRPIARPADDAVFRPIAGRLRPLRLGRGIAPLELELPQPLNHPALALGGQGKNTVALGWGRRAVVSPHLGDMDSPRSLALLRQTAEELQALHGIRAQVITCDAHPAYATSRFARTLELPVLRVPHHRAHASALAAEHDGDEPWLVFTWDGAGYGEDGSIWGGEALFGGPGRWRRVTSLRPFSLLGGERAAQEPWRSAAAVCWEAGIRWEPPCGDAPLLRHAWERGVNCPRSSSAGRLFDAAAALLGLVDVVTHEGQAPMLLEAACTGRAEPLPLPLSRRADSVWVSDWAPLMQRLCEPRPDCAALFHATLAGVVRDQAIAVRDVNGPLRVGFTGGVFQNRVLAEHALDLLRAAGFGVHLPTLLPCNDAGISYGQLVEAAAR
jgi:hydrogenase maturation protein HypF